MYGITIDEKGLIHIADAVYTNKHKLPMEVVAAILKDRYTVDGEEPSDYSASSLVAPIQQTILKKRYRTKKKLKVFDVTDDFWAFYGSIAHAVLEESWHAAMGSKVEERLYTEIKGKIISGKMDCYHDGEIRDYKTTKIYKVTKGDFKDWEMQQNIYAYLCRVNNWPIKRIKIIALLNDWKAGEKKFKQNYPDCPIKIIPLRVFDQDVMEGWLEDRVANLTIAEQLSDIELARQYPCSNEERWKNYQGTVVMKKGGKKASFKAESEDQQADMLACSNYWEERGLNEDEYDIDVRWSDPKRCMDHCPAATVCQQWAKEKPKEPEGEATF